MKLIQLSAGLYAMVDDEDFEALNAHKWSAAKRKHTHYAVRTLTGGRLVYMHRVILGAAPGTDTDHVDRNGLNNQRSNLRNATRQQNLLNRGKRKGTASIFRGVSPNRGRWGAWYAGRYIGGFDLETDAACAYDRHVLELCREFAQPNLWRGTL